MIEIDVKLKSWGNSVGVIIPKEILEKANLSKGDLVKIKIEKKDVFEQIRGQLKEKPKSGLNIDEMMK